MKNEKSQLELSAPINELSEGQIATALGMNITNVVESFSFEPLQQEGQYRIKLNVVFTALKYYKEGEDNKFTPNDGTCAVIPTEQDLTQDVSPVINFYYGNELKMLLQVGILGGGYGKTDHPRIADVTVEKAGQSSM